jgi:hypothetical protein
LGLVPHSLLNLQDKMRCSAPSTAVKVVRSVCNMVDRWTEGPAQDYSTRRLEAAVRLDNLVPRPRQRYTTLDLDRCGYLPQ